MGSLNSFALWGALGLAGIAVPIIIHLLYRKHRKETDWAAMELLRRALVIRSGQVKLEDYLILFLRCLALALLAFALLRPIMNSAESLVGGKKVGMIVAIDASLSMGHGEHSRFERALEKARQIVKTAREGDPISIVLMSNRPQVLLRGTGYVPAQVEELFKSKTAATPYGLNLERNLDLLNELAAEIKTPGKEVFIVTDSQELDWANLSTNARASFERLTKGASVYAIPSGSDGEENLSLERLSYSSGSLRKSGSARFTAHVRNTGRRATDGGAVEFFVGNELSKRLAVGPIEPGQARGLDFFVSFDKPGDIRLKAQLSQDDLVADNVRHAVARVTSSVRVLSVENPAAGGARGEVADAYYAVRAMRLKDRGEDSPIKITQIEAGDLAAEQLGDYDVILLANVPEPSPETATRIRKFVERGGGLIVFTGSRVDGALYNERFGKGADGLLPASIGKVASFTGEGGWSIGPVKSDHLLAGLVSRMNEKLLDSARFSKVVAVEPAPGSETILSIAETNTPLLLSRKVGAGTVLLFTTSADQTWSSFAVHPLYAMLMQQAVTSLTSRPDAVQFTAGEDVALPVTGREVGDSVALTKPNGEASAVRVTQNRDQTVAAIEFDQLGIYQIAADGAKPGMVLAANVDARESDVKVLGTGAIETLLAPMGVTVISKDGDLAAAIEKNRRGSELAMLLLYLAVAVFILQSILARYFTNKISRDDVPDLTAALQSSRVAAARRS
jgi:uncharacterized membrane protein